MEQIKVAVLEQKLENFEHVVSKLDSAIEKIAEVNNNVSRMLAVHEERLSKQEEIDNILFDKIDKLRDKMDGDHDSMRARISLLERRIWSVVGAMGAIVALTNPQAVKMIKPMFGSLTPAPQSSIIAERL
jgi:chromosome segregation ATPase